MGAKRKDEDEEKVKPSEVESTDEEDEDDEDESSETDEDDTADGEDSEDEGEDDSEDDDTVKKSLADRCAEDEEMVEVIDASPFVKSLVDNISGTIKDGFAELKAIQSKQFKSLKKSLETVPVVDADTIAKSVAAAIGGKEEETMQLVKSIQEQVDEIGRQPREPRTQKYVALDPAKGGAAPVTPKRKFNVIAKSVKAQLLPEAAMVTAETNPDAIPDTLILDLERKLG